jgi:ferredoxin
VRVVVNMNRCEANALCMGIAPHIFHVGDDDELVVLEENPDEGDRQKVMEAVRQCPKQAISIEEN